MTLQEYKEKHIKQLTKMWESAETQREYGNFTHFVFSKWASKNEEF